MSVDIANLFNNVLPDVISENPGLVRRMTFIINIEGAGKWFLDFAANPQTCYPYTLERADCTVTMKAEIFEEFIKNPLKNGMSLAASGRIKVSNNDMRARNLLDLFDLVKS
jgi:hypothetical protein